jgi:hypothetical protein
MISQKMSGELTSLSSCQNHQLRVLQLVNEQRRRKQEMFMPATRFSVGVTLLGLLDI